MPIRQFRHVWSLLPGGTRCKFCNAPYHGVGGSLNSIVNFGDDTFCNAYFSHDPPQMVYGNPCRGDGGLMQLATLDVAGTSQEISYAEVTKALVQVELNRPAAKVAEADDETDDDETDDEQDDETDDDEQDDETEDDD